MEVVIGSHDNFRNEDLIFDIVPFRSGYHALLGQTLFSRFNTVPHYAYLKFKMPGPKGVITVNGTTDCSLRTEEHTAALAAEVQATKEASKAQSTIKALDASKRARAIALTPESSRAHPK